MIAVFSEVYLREPNVDDTARLMSQLSKGFSGMIGGIDCMHSEWKNLTFAWQGHYSRHVERFTIILEGVTSDDLWI
jgi:hypothetical protein